ncbi:MAG: flagellar biosynthetic protein FliR [Deltaproteobacteria bacterium]|nr:flagellar biosynthetic protein FliR [Deltaproteobacteria bacterium]
MEEAIYNFVGHKTTLSDLIAIGSLIATRFTILVFMCPFLGGRLVPPESKMGIAVMLTILGFRYSVDHMTGPLEINPIAYLIFMFKEVFVGFAIGFVSAEIFYAMDIAGRTLDVMRGSNMTEVQVPELQFRASPFGDFMFQLLLMAFIALGGHAIFIEAMMESLAVVPIDALPSFSHGFDSWVDHILKYSSDLYAIAFALVFPGVFATFMVDLMFGMLNRVAPQLNAYFMAMAVKPLGGMMMFAFSMTFLMAELARQAEQMIVHVRHTLSLFQ